MKNRFATAVIVLVALALLAGCGRKTANDATTVPDAAPTPPATHSTASGVTHQTGIDSKSEMVQISGGRFMMGDKNEVDATPHEVIVSSFYIDKHLVTQEQLQEVMGGRGGRWKGEEEGGGGGGGGGGVRFCNKRSE